MATPLTADRFIAALKNEGVHVAEHPGWRTHERDTATNKPFGPVHGILIHHTAGTNSLPAIYNGRPDLPGPLAHTHLSKTGLATMCSAGRANHAGLVALNAYNAILNESPTHPKPSKTSGTVDGNDVLYGIEIENLGNGKDPYPTVQYNAAVRWAAALCRAHGWSANSVVGHKETSIEGKIDPSFDMVKFRRDVATRLTTRPTTTAPATSTTTTGTGTLVSSAYTAVSLTGTPQSFTTGQTREIYFTAEQFDDPGDHGTGGKAVLSGPAQFSGAVKLKFAAPVPAGVKASLVRQASNTTVASEWTVEIPEGAEVYPFPAIGTVATGQDLVLTIINGPNGPITLSEAYLRINSQAL